MNTDITVFNHEKFGEIRTMTDEKGETFFVGKDVAMALGYAKPQNALAKHVDKEDKGTAPIHGTAYETRVVIINESGLRLFIVLLPGACTPVCGLSPLLSPLCYESVTECRAQGF